MHHNPLGNERQAFPKFILELDYYEDRSEINILMNATKMFVAIEEARNLIRSRLKYGEGVSDEEEKLLEEINRVLYIEDIQ